MSGRSPEVVIIGGTYIDMDIKCGEIPTPGQSVSGSALSYSLTGPGPNQAIEAALCGCSVHLISKVGGDSFAHTAKMILIEYDVDTEFIYTAGFSEIDTNVPIVFNRTSPDEVIRITVANADPVSLIAC